MWEPQSDALPAELRSPPSGEVVHTILDGPGQSGFGTQVVPTRIAAKKSRDREVFGKPLLPDDASKLLRIRSIFSASPNRNPVVEFSGDAAFSVNFKMTFAAAVAFCRRATRSRVWPIRVELRCVLGWSGSEE